MPFAQWLLCAAALHDSSAWAAWRATCAAAGVAAGLALRHASGTPIMQRCAQQRPGRRSCRRAMQVWLPAVTAAAAAAFQARGRRPTACKSLPRKLTAPCRCAAECSLISGCRPSAGCCAATTPSFSASRCCVMARTAWPTCSSTLSLPCSVSFPASSQIVGGGVQGSYAVTAGAMRLSAAVWVVHAVAVCSCCGDVECWVQ